MSLAKKAFHGVKWLSFFRLLSQVYSWVITIQVARLLIPDDYALMAMSTILTGYAMMFSNLGLGSAIIYHKEATRKELSSVFWLSAAIGVGFGLLAVVLAYPTAVIFKNKALIPLTQAVSVLFVLNALQIVPISIQNRDLKFKAIGLIEMLATLIASTAMFLMARAGFGVWTLLLGSIFLSAVKLILSFVVTREWPLFHYSGGDVKKFLSFGILTSIGTSLKYVFEKSDRFFAGRAWAPTPLGHYQFALDLSQLPVSKITSIINQVSFPVFSQLQNDREKFNDFYRAINKLLLLCICPLFVGGYMVGEDLIKVLLNPKWYPIIPVFKILCLVQVFTILSSVNNYVHGALGNPRYYMVYNAFLAAIMAASFAFVVKYDFSYIWVPWATSYPALCLAWMVFTMHKIGVRFRDFLSDSVAPSIGLAGLFGVVFLAGYAMEGLTLPPLVSLAVKIAAAVLFYAGWLFLTEKKFLASIIKKVR